MLLLSPAQVANQSTLSPPPYRESTQLLSKSRKAAENDLFWLDFNPEPEMR